MNLRSNDRDVIARLLNDRLQDPVRIAFVSQESTNLEPPLHTPCHWCSEAENLIKELVSLNDTLSLIAYDFMKDTRVAEEYGVDKIPALIPLSDRDHGIRIFGVPAGYEFAAFLEAVVDVSRGETSLGQKTKTRVRDLTRDVHIQVLVSPTCPFCPAAVRLAHQMALESPRIRADMIEIQEFPHLAQRYNVQGVPKIVINEKTSIEGTPPESLLLLHILKASGDLTPDEDKQFLLYSR